MACHRLRGAGGAAVHIWAKDGVEVPGRTLRLARHPAGLWGRSGTHDASSRPVSDWLLRGARDRVRLRGRIGILSHNPAASVEFASGSLAGSAKAAELHSPLRQPTNRKSLCRIRNLRLSPVCG